jgi:hypothetical protein
LRHVTFGDVLLVIFIVDINFVVAKKFCFVFAGVPLRVRGERLQELPRQGASLSGEPKLFPDLVSNFKQNKIFCVLVILWQRIETRV